MKIFVQHDGETYGPFSREEVVAHLQQGVLAETDLACAEGNLEGIPLKDLLKEEALDVSPEQTTAKQDLAGPAPSIFVQHDGEIFGPFTKEQIIAHIQGGVLSAGDFACTEENLEGRPLKDFLGEAETAVPSSEKIQAEAKIPQTQPLSLLDLQIFRESSRVQEPQVALGSRKVLLLAAACLVCFYGAGIATYFAFKPKSPQPTSLAATVSSTLSAPNTPIQQAPTPAIAAAASVNQIATTAPVAVDGSGSPNQPGLANTTPANNDVPQLANTTAGENVPDNPAVENPPAPQAVPATAPKPVLATTHQIALPKEKGKPRGDLWVADTAPNPKAILVVCLSPNGNTQGTVKNQSWQDFAKENGLALAAITFSSDQDMLKPDTNNARPGSAAENILIAGLHGNFGDKVPLILYGREAGGLFAINIADWHPELVKVWGAYTSQWPLAPQPSKISPPAVLACDIESIQRGKTQIHDYFAAGRAQNRPWTMVPVATDPKLRQQVFDLFFCDYVKACLDLPTGKNPGGVLVGTESKKLYSALDAMTRPKEATWLPNAAMIDKWTSAMSAEELGGKPTIVQKDISTSNPKQPHLKMYLRLPPGVKSGKEVTGVLAYCTWDSNEATIVATLSIQANEKLTGLAAHHSGTLANLIRFADDHKMAVLTWGTVTVWNAAVSNEDMAASQRQKIDETFDALAAAWEKGIHEYSQENGLPTKDYLLYGISRGAQWAHRLALRKPAYFLAVDIHIPSSFDVPTPDANRPLWLLTTGEQEYGYASAKNFYKECVRLGYPIIFKAIPNLGHMDSPIADNLTSQFFEYALSVRNIHDAHEMQLQNHFVLSNGQSIPPWIESFREPAYFGDLLNQDCFPGAQVSMIESTLRVPLPTKGLADAWNK